MKSHIPTLAGLLQVLPRGLRCTAVCCLTLMTAPGSHAAPVVRDLASDAVTLQWQGVVANHRLGGDGVAISRTLATGDLNGDGMGDVVIASEKYGSTGDVRIIFGRADWTASTALVSAVADVTITGASLQRLANAAACGDVNGDGISDLVLGGITLDAPGLEDCGKVLIWFGRTVWPASLGLAGADVSITGDTAFGQFGDAVAVADQDGDGMAEIAVSAPRHSFTRTGLSGELFGKLYLYAGRTAWPAALTTADARTVIHGPHYHSLLGAVLWTGDCNGDGMADLFIGAHGARPTGVTPVPASKKIGQVWGLHGRAAAGWPAATDLLDFSTGTLSPLVDFHAPGDNVHHGVGFRGACGDVNGDGVDDLIVAGFGVETRLYVYFGRADFGVFDPPMPADIGTRRDRVWTTPNVSSTAASISSIVVGDCDGDGLGDVISGFNTAHVSGRNQAGLVAVRYGRSEWPVLAEDDDLHYHGSAATDGLGTMVACGDVTGDGVADLIFSASGADRPGASNCGKVYVVAGAASPPETFLTISGGSLELRVTSRSGRTCRLESSADLSDWTALHTWNTTGADTVITVPLTSRQFFRVLENPVP